MRIHLIAIGGAIMHQIAITSARKGHQVTGSDDVIQEPSRSRLIAAGIMPEREGFFADNITSDIDLVILGMHAKFDNPELTRAMEMGIKVLSFPEYIYENSKDKTRVVIAGSHGKTSMTSMIMHCLKENQMDFDYLVGSSVAGFDYSVKLSDAPIIVIEGDEYLASPINKEPKFIYYKANLAVLSGIEWDHINVFKTEEIYDQQFQKLVMSMEAGANMFYYQEDKIKSIISGLRDDVTLTPYKAIDYTIENEIFLATTPEGKVPLSVFGKHNMENIQAAKNICLALGMEEMRFWKAIASFQGAGRRLELLKEDETKVIYKDFAHSPSKLKATIQAVKEKYKNRTVIACFEMHTFSTLTAEFLPQYHDTMAEADIAVVYIDKNVVGKKGNMIFSEADIKTHFDRIDLHYITDLSYLTQFLNEKLSLKPVYLMMTSGIFSGLDLKEIGVKPIVPVAITPTEINSSYRVENKDMYSMFPTKALSREELEASKKMFALSYILFIIAPAYFYFMNKEKGSIPFLNIIKSCFNFQTMSVFILIFGIIISKFISIAFFMGLFFNIYFTHKAIQQLIYQMPIEIPQGAMALIPTINKE